MIGPPDEPFFVLNKCLISYSLIFSIPIPYETEGSFASGYCKIYIGSFLYEFSELCLNIFLSISK